MLRELDTELEGRVRAMMILECLVAIDATDSNRCC